MTTAVKTQKKQIFVEGFSYMSLTRFAQQNLYVSYYIYSRVSDLYKEYLYFCYKNSVKRTNPGFQKGVEADTRMRSAFQLLFTSDSVRDIPGFLPKKNFANILVCVLEEINNEKGQAIKFERKRLPEAIITGVGIDVENGLGAGFQERIPDKSCEMGAHLTLLSL